MRLSVKASWLRDPSLWSLMAANMITIILASIQQWSLATTLWVFWGQSVSIGIVAIMRVMLGEARGEYGHGFVDGAARFFGNLVSVGVFLLHYGGFHLIYFLLLRDFFGFPPGERHVWLLAGAGAFFLHHAYSFVYHRWRKGTVQTRPIHPYTRILPLHLTLVLFPVVLNAVVLFLIIRAAVDLCMHGLEHGGAKGREVNRG